jgi:hypothetical protein
LQDEPTSADAMALDEITKRCFQALDEIALLRRLVLSMALNIDADFMPHDERKKLLEIMGDD